MILFAALTAEEQGLLLSEYLAKHSPVMLPRISSDMNFDALVPTGDPEEVEVWGAKRTTFYSSLEGTARTFGLTIRSPGSRVLYGSERFNLARAGIPSFSIPEGLRFKGHDEAWLRQATWSTSIIKRPLNFSLGRNLLPTQSCYVRL